jgi:hypothetical protein
LILFLTEGYLIDLVREQIIVPVYRRRDCSIVFKSELMEDSKGDAEEEKSEKDP